MSANTIRSTGQVLETFSDPDLVSHGYLDTALEQYNPLTQQAELHSATSQLLSQLDHASQELTWKLESTMSELCKSGPRLNYEVELLRSGVAGLVSDIEEVEEGERKNKSANSENDKDSSKDSSNNENSEATMAMRRLQQLEKVRHKMQEVEAVLREAQQMDQPEGEQAITSEIILLVDAGDLEGAVKKVERLAELVPVWKGTARYSAKVKFVGTLRKRIEEAAAAVDGGTARTLSATEQQQTDRTRNPDSARNSPGPESEGYYGLLGHIRGRIGY